MQVRKAVLRAAGAAMVACAIAPWLGAGSASAVDRAGADTFLKASQQNTVAAGFASQGTDCPNFSADGHVDMWHFVIDGTYEFTALTAHFNTGDVTITTFGPPDAKHAYVSSPAGATLLDAWATVTPEDENIPADFQLSHVCVGTPAPSSPPPSSSPPSSSPPSSAPPVTTPPPTTVTPQASVLPTKKSTPKTSVLGTKAGSELPHTGNSLPVTALVVISLGLLAGGGALVAAPAVARSKKPRRH